MWLLSSGIKLMRSQLNELINGSKMDCLHLLSPILVLIHLSMDLIYLKTQSSKQQVDVVNVRSCSIALKPLCQFCINSVYYTVLNYEAVLLVNGITIKPTF